MFGRFDSTAIALLALYPFREVVIICAGLIFP